MFCVHEVVAPLCVTLALPIHLTVVGLRPRANWHSHPWCNPGGTGSPATLCYIDIPVVMVTLLIALSSYEVDILYTDIVVSYLHM